ncbi:hypothetical protein KST_00925 [Mycobacterium marinum]|nr:hypothetical protein KST_00925 [Mycobacterium marinum]
MRGMNVGSWSLVTTLFVNTSCTNSRSTGFPLNSGMGEIVGVIMVGRNHPGAEMEGPVNPLTVTRGVVIGGMEISGSATGGTLMGGVVI